MTITEPSKHLVGQQYSWASSAFYFGYLAASIPGSVGFVKFPIGKYLATAVLCWSLILACHGAATNFATLMVLRVLLGVFESIISPGFSLITSLWYKPSEHSLRHGIWFAGNGLASIFGGLLGYGIGKIHDKLPAWRWLFIIFGLITFLWALVLLVFLPDSALAARWLTPHERELAHSRPQKKTHSFKSTYWKPHQALEAIKDPKTWLLFFYTAFTSLPNGGVTNVRYNTCTF
jgi:ACS family allantoate permease-like MFS transporter